MTKSKSSPPKVAAYYRYSSDKWAQKDNSEERQKEKCLGLIADRKWHLVEEFSDKETSGDDTKPDLMRLKGRLEIDLKIDLLVVDDLSRLTRKGPLEVHEDLAWLRDRGIKLCQAKDGSIVDLNDPNTMLVLGIEVWKNNLYLKDLAKASAGGMLTKFKQKRLGWIGRAPLGFDLVKRHKDEGPSYLVPNEDLKIVRQIFQEFLAGATIRSLALMLEKTERHTRKDGKTTVDPSAQSVKNMLRNSIYCGIRSIGVRSVGKHANVAGREERFIYNVNPLEYAAETWEIEGLEKAVSVEDFKRVQKMLDKNKVSFTRRPPSAGHRYSSYLICANCGGHMVADNWKHKTTGVETVFYRCAAANQVGRKCREEKPYNKQVDEQEIDESLKRIFAEFMGNAQVHYSFIESLFGELKRREAIGGNQSNQAIEELSLLEQRLDGAWKFFESQGFNSQDTLNRIKQYQVDIDRKRQEIESQISGKSSVIDFAEKQYRLGLQQKGPQKYLGCCYRVALDVALGKLDWNNKNAKIKAVQSAVFEGMHYVGQELTIFEYEDGEEVLVPSNPDEVFDQLKSMGLSQIKLYWELGTKRGKPKRVVSHVELMFLDGGITHIGTG